MNADAAIYAGLFDSEQTASMALDTARLTYLHLARGTLEVNGHLLGGGDGALLDGETQLTLQHGDGAEVLVFDLSRS